MNATKTLTGDPLIDQDQTPDPDAVRKLCDTFGYKPEAVRKWSRSRVIATLEARMKEQAVALARAEHKAVAEGNANGEPVMRGRVPQPIRMAAAVYLRESLTKGPDETVLALSYACCHLQDDEAKKLAAFMAGKFEGRE